MVFTSLSKKSPIGNSFMMGLDPEVAEILQKVAWKTYENFQIRVMNSDL